MMERSDLSKKDQVRNYLIRELQSGKYPKGAVFLSENTLIQRLGICKNTVREAYSSLVSDGLLERIRRCLCWHVMAEAVMKFDLTELPRSIRWDLTHEFSKTGSQMQVRERLYSNLMTEVDNWYADIEASVRLLRGSPDRVANTNEESNKYYAIL